MNPRVAGVGLAVPPHVVTSAQAKTVAGKWFAERVPGFDRVSDVFDHEHLGTRHLAQPWEWYAKRHSFPDKNDAYCRIALELMQQAAEQAIMRAGIDRGDIETVVLASSTGLSTPSLDATLVQCLDLGRHVQRTPMWGLGCAGGAAVLARGATLVRGSGRPVLVVACELCSLTFVSEDATLANVVATALFGDGAAAAVLVPGDAGEGIELVASHSRLFDDSQHVMGWDVVAEGFKVRFARSIPSIVERESADFVHAACARADIRREQLEHFVVHPGGPSVLEAYGRSLSLPPDQLDGAWQVLRRYGNMSGPTVIFVLDEFLRASPASGQWGILTALGPGFAAEGVVFRT